MPLFGKKHDKSAGQHSATTDAQDVRQDPSTLSGAGATGTNAPMNQGQDFTGTNQDPNNFSNRGAGQQNWNSGGQGANPYTGGQQQQQGAGVQPLDNQAGLAPTNHLQGQGHSHPGTRAAGKVEHAIGTLVGSTALQARGNEKEQEANAFKQQSREIAEAERLEREAMQRRERAVAQGAHPENRQLGGPGHQAAF
ncbi:hypothetical protein BV25DRAFT_1987980 [Artomyces pyxidatus]|uniref:Uncharacterized protein n=1 Tax=Artomyces pyxidatus TaxID=48021 RepID=A0ACB8TEL7_9AGAM|nr:hypothetical protein BV25DRAFT_1987980 [Artomyces pyxidatus]